MDIQILQSMMRNFSITHLIYVLEDGETYSGDPATPVIVTTAQLERIEAGEKVCHVVPDWNKSD